MSEIIGHECGIVAVALKRPIESYENSVTQLGGATPWGLQALQRLKNRGQQAAGIAIYDPRRERKKLEVIKNPGKVEKVFHFADQQAYEKFLQEKASVMMIGHTRYTTSGDNVDDETQPFHSRHFSPDYKFAFGYNGNLANHAALEERLCQEYADEFDLKVDTELIMSLITKSITRRHGDYTRIPADIYGYLDGAYNIVLLNGRGELFAFRDPRGFRPLVYGENENFLAIASESFALHAIGIYETEDVTPGHMLSLTHGIFEEERFTREAVSLSHCFFEWLYFANFESKFNGVAVADIRKNLGQGLARSFPQELITAESIVVPVPKTSIPIAQAMAHELGIPYVEAILATNDRSFIQEPGVREMIANGKYRYLFDQFTEKDVLLVDDSIVRGVTLDSVIHHVRSGKPKTVRLLSACPPLRYPCFYGIDFPSRHELAAALFPDLDALTTHLAEKSGADSIHYQTMENLLQAYPSSIRDNLCLACLTGKYPTEAGTKRVRTLLEQEKKQIQEREGIEALVR